MKISLKLASLTFCSAFMVAGFVGQASAGVILSGTSCVASHVTAGVSGADACLGLYDKTTGSAGPNDSEAFLNSKLVLDDGSNTVEWLVGAFGINDWSFLGKDEQTSNVFIDVTNGDPATWSVLPSSLLNQSYLFAAKQGNILGLYVFGGLFGVSAGMVDMNAIFGLGTSDDGWSHFSVYTSSTDIPSTPFTPVPEPGILSLLGLGLLGLGLSRRRMKA